MVCRLCRAACSASTAASFPANPSGTMARDRPGGFQQPRCNLGGGLFQMDGVDQDLDVGIIWIRLYGQGQCAVKVIFRQQPLAWAS